MVDLDPIDEWVRDGLARTERELEALADRLSPPETTPEAAANWADSDEGKNAGAILAQMIGEGLRGLILADRPPRIPSARRLWRFTSPTPTPAVAAAPPPPVAAAPPAEMMPGVQSEPPKASGTPNTEAPLQIPGLSFVGHVNDRPEARDSRRFPVEFMSGHQERINIDVREPISRPPLRGPVIGSRE